MVVWDKNNFKVRNWFIFNSAERRLSNEALQLFLCREYVWLIKCDKDMTDHTFLRYVHVTSEEV